MSWIREAPVWKMPGLFGHCPNSDCTPPPSLKRALWGTLFPDWLEQMPFELQFSLHRCPKPSWQGFRPPNQANAPLNMDNSSQNKCPKPFGQGSRPPPPLGQCPNRPGIFQTGASLRQIRRFLDKETNKKFVKVKIQFSSLSFVSLSARMLNVLAKGLIISIN